MELFKHSERLNGLTSLPANQINEALAPEHGQLVKMGEKKKHCDMCVAAKRKAKHVTKRKALSELSTNTIRAKTRREQYPKSIYGCALCGIHLCNKNRCWVEHIQAIP